MKSTLALASAVVTAALTLAACTADNAHPEPPAALDPQAVHDMSPEEERAYLKEIGDGLLASFSMIQDAPEHVPVRRWIRSEEADRVNRECLIEAGFPMNSDGSFSTGGQWESYWRAWYVCQMAYPVIPRYAGSWGPEQIEAQYAYTLDYLIPCLENYGITSGEPPTKETFIATWDTNPYTPWNSVPNLSGPTALELEDTCPQHAPSGVLWDGEPVPAPPNS